MHLFQNLSLSDRIELLKFPAYISMLAASCNDKLDETEKATAIKFAHTRTFTCDPILAEFYTDADKVFEKLIDQLDKDLPKDKAKREAAIKKELLIIDRIITKMGKEYSILMKRSMKSFKEHVSKSHNSVFVNFIFPLPIQGLTQ